MNEALPAVGKERQREDIAAQKQDQKGDDRVYSAVVQRDQHQPCADVGQRGYGDKPQQEGQEREHQRAKAGRRGQADARGQQRRNQQQGEGAHQRAHQLHGQVARKPEIVLIHRAHQLVAHIALDNGGSQRVVVRADHAEKRLLNPHISGRGGQCGQIGARAV